MYKISRSAFSSLGPRDHGVTDSGRRAVRGSCIPENYALYDYDCYSQYKEWLIEGIDFEIVD